MTNRLFSVDKSKSVVLFQKDAIFRENARVFVNESVTKDDVIQAGEKLFLTLFVPRGCCCSNPHPIYLSKMPFWGSKFSNSAYDLNFKEEKNQI